MQNVQFCGGVEGGKGTAPSLGSGLVRFGPVWSGLLGIVEGSSSTWPGGIPRWPREVVSPLGFVARNWILPREPIDFIGWNRRFQKWNLENAEQIDNVKQQSLVNHPVRFTGRKTKRRSEGSARD